MSKIIDRDDWFEIWYEDKKSMLSTMVKNMTSDLDNGYDFFGACILRQINNIERYMAKFDEEMEAFKGMEEKAVNRWCYYDLKKRGAID